MRRTFLALGMVSGLLLSAGACGPAKLPRPPYARHPSSAMVEVPYPPPPARVEMVPESPQEGAVWIDGEWTWQATRWAWKRGRWVIPPSGAAFAPWTHVRNGDGTLFVAEGAWRDPRTRGELEAPRVLAMAKAGPGEVVDAEGDRTSTGRSIVPEGADAGRRGQAAGGASQ